MGSQPSAVSPVSLSPFRMHPAVMAQRLATIDQISQGRVNLALGVGESMNLDAYNSILEIK